MPTEKAKQIGERLRMARKEKGWNKTQAAQAVGTAPSVWKRYEDGDADPSLTKLLDISEAFRRPAAWFLADVDDEMLRRQLGGLDPLLVAEMSQHPMHVQRAVARAVPLVRSICQEEGIEAGM